MARQMAQGKVPAPEANPWGNGAGTGKEFLKGAGRVAGKVLGGVGMLYDVANEASGQSVRDRYLAERASGGDEKSAEVLANGGSNPIMNSLKQPVRQAVDAVDNTVVGMFKGNASQPSAPSAEKQAAPMEGSDPTKIVKNSELPNSPVGQPAPAQALPQPAAVAPKPIEIGVDPMSPYMERTDKTVGGRVGREDIGNRATTRFGDFDAEGNPMNGSGTIQFADGRELSPEKMASLGKRMDFNSSQAGKDHFAREAKITADRTAAAEARSVASNLSRLASAGHPHAMAALANQRAGDLAQSNWRAEQMAAVEEKQYTRGRDANKDEADAINNQISNADKVAGLSKKNREELYPLIQSMPGVASELYGAKTAAEQEGIYAGIYGDLANSFFNKTGKNLADQPKSVQIQALQDMYSTTNPNRPGADHGGWEFGSPSTWGDSPRHMIGQRL